jgi:hypothetical protein
MRCEKSYNQGRQDLENEILTAKPFSAKIQNVKDEISRFYNTHWEIIAQRQSSRGDCLLAKQAFCYICKTFSLAPDKIIASEAGYTDRSAVRHSQRLVKDLMDVQPEIKNQVLHILNRLK